LIDVETVALHTSYVQIRVKNSSSVSNITDLVLAMRAAGL